MTTYPPVQLLESRAYVSELTTKISQATRRVSIMSLIIADDETTHDLIVSLKAAASRGVTVDIAADSFTFSEFGGALNPFKQQTARSRMARQMGNELSAAGASFTWLDDRLKLNPFAGVTHSKWSVVDDTCYVFGGVNLYVDGIRSTDYMLRLTDAQLADDITLQQQAIAASPTPLYEGYTASSHIGTWYVDSGKRNDSIIYDRAVELARQAEKILYVSQYCPSGPLATSVKDKGECYFNQPRNASFLTSLMLTVDQMKTGIHSRYRHTNYLHAKFIIYTMPGGEKVALTGSHNFSHKGVVFGTREVALETNDPEIIGQLEAFFQVSIR
ncbi:phospholipase D-like domain-containing protein [Streptomyces caniscabiei]|uniref:phospholipase D-like domain-containing protein n=1 Tax=Streptomyces caniscabiei TaxID=2746961 RepID=UPI0029B22FB6|nr:phospholipase D-like domain-containing protein [Streptomyces caniscabiei]MDX2776542.1 phospholipase D-like domain-containing protein [Streptomyces caniscabiei]